MNYIHKEHEALTYQKIRFFVWLFTYYYSLILSQDISIEFVIKATILLQNDF